MRDRPETQSMPQVSTIILRTATIFLMPLLLLLSVFMLLRGHNDPGGGFIGGLLAAAAFVLHALAYDVASTRRLIRFEPHQLAGFGLLLAAGSGVPALFGFGPYMTGLWGSLHWLGLPDVKLGTPLVFDAGVYVTVVGMALLIILPLAEEELA